MTINQKKDTLTNALRSYGFPEKYFIHIADRRMGQKFAIATSTETSLNVHTNYMPYNELNSYLIGYNKALTNHFKA